MRDPSGVELLLFARALLPVQAEARGSVASRILQEVDEADQYLRLLNRCHPAFGDGSLMARCLPLSPPAEPPGNDRDFLCCLVTACLSLLQHSKA